MNVRDIEIIEKWYYFAKIRIQRERERDDTNYNFNSSVQFF